MMKMDRIKRLFVLNMLLALVAQVFAQGPNGTGTYYQNADGKSGKELKTAMAAIINPHTQLEYNDLWEAFKTTDRRDDGKVWDMYSSRSNFEFGVNQDDGKSAKEGDKYNREHSMPKSWFNDEYPMYTDLTHIIPADKWVNSLRGNAPFGETKNPSNCSDGDFSKFGPSSVSGYTGSVFEPNDEYKGDFARIYFYMVTCYEKNVSSWNSEMLAQNEYPAFTGWALDMLLRWAAQDPVSQKEIDRNNAVYGIQGNRNPYVDYPGLEQYVWGESTTKAFSYDGYVTPDFPDYPVDPDEPVGPVDPPASGSFTFTKVTSESQLEAGGTYIIVYENGAIAMGGTNGKYRDGVDITLTDGKIVTDVNGNGQPRAFILGGSKDAYTLYDGVENVYLALNSGDNALHGNATATEDKEKWSITFNDNCTIQSNAYPDRYIYYNASSPRFACYKTTSKQQPVALYKGASTVGITNVAANGGDTVDVFTVAGTKIRSNVARENALNGLDKGVYIIGNKKYLVK